MRARLAGAALLVAPLLVVASELLALLAGPEVATAALWLGFAAWIPSVLCLEHFLKQVADTHGALANGVGLVGALLGTNAVAARWALSTSEGGSARHVAHVEVGSTCMLATALVLFGIGYAKHRIAPKGPSIGLAVTSALWFVGALVGVEGLRGAGVGGVALTAGWIGLRVLRGPELWEQPFLTAPDRRRAEERSES